MLRRDAILENSAHAFTLIRVEHRPPDGPPRVLAQTTLWGVAIHAARTWQQRLRRQGSGGDLVVMAEDTGAVLTSYPVPPSGSTEGGLTVRQAEALTLLCAGLTVAEIAERLGVSTSAVYQLRWAIRQHLGVDSMAEACRSLASPGDEPNSTR